MADLARTVGWFMNNAAAQSYQHMVVEDMLRGLGAQLSPVEAPFEPEPGAYGHEHRHGHDDYDS